MKKLNLILLMFVMVFLAACEKDAEKVIIKESISANDLSNLSASTFVLTMDNAANEFQKFTWTEVDYGFDVAVTYTVQCDVKGNSFASPIDIVTSSGTSASITIGAFNTLLLNAGLEPDVATDMQFRVKSVINKNVAPVYADVVEAKVTPYATSFPPIYMTGAATGGWGWALYQYKELRSSAPSVYETIGYFLNNETFRFFKQTDWNPTSWNYQYFTTVDVDLTNANDGDKNFRVVGATGYYTITVNMKTKTVVMEPAPDQVLYATGAALGGWDWTTNYIQLTWLSNGIYRATTDFANETFRFFKQAGWGDSYNYPWFAGGTVSPLFENANDGDKNFRFIGTTGSYTITVNLLDKIITMTQP